LYVSENDISANTCAYFGKHLKRQIRALSAILYNVMMGKMVFMPRFLLTVLTTRNETSLFWKRIFKFQNSNFMSAVSNRLSILFTN